MQSFSVIGLGKLGLSIAIGLSAQGRLLWTMNRGQEQRNSAKFLLPPSLPVYADVQRISLPPPPCIIIAVADDAIEDIAGQLVQQFGSALRDVAVVHCSGVKTRAALQVCEAEGAITMGLHPYQTFTIPTSKNFKDIAWGAELPSVQPFQTIAEQFAQDIVKTLGGHWVMLSAETLANKPLYHASAVFAANYLNALVGFAAETAEAAGIQPQEFLPQIMHKALENALSNLKHRTPGAFPPGAFPLTGPISRGDLSTLREHLAAFSASPNSASSLQSYCLFGIATAEFAHRQGFINAERYGEITELFQNALRSTSTSSVI
jgi:predicted short-subunit dehydrogenase-like oxidoreductase (DUF2520 family)